MFNSLDELSKTADAVAKSSAAEDACELFSRYSFGALAQGDCTTAVRALHRQALFLARNKRFEAAEEIALLALEIASAWKIPRLIARETNLLGLLAYLQLDWKRALDSYVSALALAQADHDDELIAGICLNLGIIENILGRLQSAKSYYLESVGAAVRCGERAYLVMTYNNLGMVCSDLEEWMEALVYFDRGIEIADELENERLLAMLHANRAEPLIELEEWGRVNDSLRLADRLATRGKFSDVLTDVARFRARSARRNRDYEAALSHVRQAIDIANSPDLRLHWAEAVEERGCIHRDLGHAERALDDFLAARDAYCAIAAENDVVRIDRCIGGLNRIAGKHEGSASGTAE